MDSLAPELVKQVFEDLYSLDEVQNLALTSKYLYDVFFNHREAICYVVVLSSPFHVFDARFCQLAQINDTATTKLLGLSTLNDQDRPLYDSHKHLLENPTVSLKRTMIPRILAHWRTVGELFCYYQTPSVKELYNKLQPSHWTQTDFSEEETLEGLELTEKRDSEAKPWLEANAAIKRDKRKDLPHADLLLNDTKLRFYKAATWHSINVEARNLLRISHFRRWTDQNTASRTIYRLWSATNGIPLEVRPFLWDYADHQEVHDFVCHFLGRTLFADLDNLPSWFKDYEAQNTTRLIDWTNQVEHIGCLLRLADFLELLDCSGAESLQAKRLAILHARCQYLAEDSPEIEDGTFRSTFDVQVPYSHGLYYSLEDFVRGSSHDFGVDISDYQGSLKFRLQLQRISRTNCLSWPREENFWIEKLLYVRDQRLSNELTVAQG